MTHELVHYFSKSTDGGPVSVTLCGADSLHVSHRSAAVTCERCRRLLRGVESTTTEINLRERERRIMQDQITKMGQQLTEANERLAALERKMDKLLDQRTSR